MSGYHPFSLIVWPDHDESEGDPPAIEDLKVATDNLIRETMNKVAFQHAEYGFTPVRAIISSISTASDIVDSIEQFSIVSDPIKSIAKASIRLNSRYGRKINIGDVEPPVFMEVAEKSVGVSGIVTFVRLRGGRGGRGKIYEAILDKAKSRIAFLKSSTLDFIAEPKSTAKDNKEIHFYLFQTQDVFSTLDNGSKVTREVAYNALHEWHEFLANSEDTTLDVMEVVEEEEVAEVEEADAQSEGGEACNDLRGSFAPDVLIAQPYKDYNVFLWLTRGVHYHKKLFPSYLFCDAQNGGYGDSVTFCLPAWSFVDCHHFIGCIEDDFEDAQTKVAMSACKLVKDFEGNTDSTPDVTYTFTVVVTKKAEFRAHLASVHKKLFTSIEESILRIKSARLECTRSCVDVVILPFEGEMDSIDESNDCIINTIANNVTILGSPDFSADSD